MAPQIQPPQVSIGSTPHPRLPARFCDDKNYETHKDNVFARHGLMTDNEADELYAPALWPYSATTAVGPPMEHWGNCLSPIWEGNSEPTNSVPGSKCGFSNKSSQAGRSEQASTTSRHSRVSTDPSMKRSTMVCTPYWMASEVNNFAVWEDGPNLCSTLC